MPVIYAHFKDLIL